MGATGAVREHVQKEFAATVAANIRAEAAARRMSQSELAKALGWAMTTVNARWTGRRDWQLEDVEAVAAVFGLRPVDLCVDRHGPARLKGLEPPTFWLGDDDHHEGVGPADVIALDEWRLTR